MLEISLLPRINPYAVGERGVVSGESDLSDADLGYEICHIFINKPPPLRCTLFQKNASSSYSI